MKYVIFLILFCTSFTYTAEPNPFQAPAISDAKIVRSLMFEIANTRSRESRGEIDPKTRREIYGRIKAELDKVSVKPE